jgi:ecotropic viral integration site 5 protein
MSSESVLDAKPDEQTASPAPHAKAEINSKDDSMKSPTSLPTQHSLAIPISPPETEVNDKAEEAEDDHFDDVDEGAKFEDLDLNALDDTPQEEPLITPRPKSQIITLHEEPKPSNETNDVESPPPPPALDALLSPTRTEHSVRESVAASDTTDDESTRFSTVMLSSARQSLADAPEVVETHEGLESPTHTLAETATLHDDRRDTLDGSELIRLIHTNRTHKKTVSTSTIVSGIISRAGMDDGESNRRASLEGKQRLQEEFERNQGDADIDWGMWLN